MDEAASHGPASAGGIDDHDNPESVDMDMANSSDDGHSRDEPDQDNQCKKSPHNTDKHSIDRRLEQNIEENLKYARYRSNHANHADPDGRFDQQDSRDSPVSDKNHVTKDTPSKPSNIIYVTNISPFVTLEQMKILFGFVGEILDIAMFHFDPNPDTNFKVCFVEFTKHSSVVVAQHLTNTVFIDRAIFVLPFNHSRIPPDKETAIKQGYDDKEYVTNFNLGVVSQVTAAQGGAQIITTSDARLAASNLQTYPQLPINTDPTRVEEIRRTLYIGNLDSSLAPELVLKFFNDMGEVKYIRIAGDENQPTRFAFVEFTHQASVANALLHHGFTLGSRSLKINHSNNPIVKPQPKLEIDDNLRRSHKDSKHLSRGDRRRDRSRGYHERRSPRNSRSRRSRERDLPRSRTRQSRSRDHRRSRSRDDISRRRSRSRDSRKRRSRSRSIERSRKKSSRRR